MRTVHHALLVLTALASPLFAQQKIGATYRVAPSVASRAGGLGAAVTMIARFDHDDYVGWGKNGAATGTRRIQGVYFESTDADGSTAESFSVVVYGESVLNPGFPDVSAPLLTVGPFTNPQTAPGNAGFTTTITFAPIAVPDTKDIFVGIACAAVNSWPADGHAVNCVLGHAARWSTFDLPGQAPIQEFSYALGYQPAIGAPAYNTPRQLLIDILCDSPGGECTAITNQPQYAISNNSPGTGNYLSGLHPDAVSPPLNPGRADNVGFAFLDGSLPNFTPVIFMADLGGFGPEVPLAGFLPGSVGVFCLKPASAQSLGLQFLQNGEAVTVISIPANVRPLLTNLPLLQQAFALVTASNIVRSSPCGRQVF